MSRTRSEGIGMRGGRRQHKMGYTYREKGVGDNFRSHSGMLWPSVKILLTNLTSERETKKGGGREEKIKEIFVQKELHTGCAKSNGGMASKRAKCEIAEEKIGGVGA